MKYEEKIWQAWVRYYNADEDEGIPDPPPAFVSGFEEGEKRQKIYTRGAESAWREAEDSVREKQQEIDALKDAICALRDFVEGKRTDTENISQILNGALCLEENLS